jgi:predicted phosphodiesterase
MKFSLVSFAFPIGLLIALLVRASDKQKLLVNNEKPKYFKIAVISDLNASYGSTNYHPAVAATLNELKVIKPDMILCAGDMVAGQKATLSQQNLDSMWTSFNEQILMPIKAMNIPFGFTVGNHDAAPNFLKDRATAKQFWSNNQQQLNLNFVDQANFPFYYSYTKSDVFFVSWDAAGANFNDDVFTWMEKQLNSVKAKKAKLRILLGHLPIYAIVNSKNKPGEVLAQTNKITQFLKRNNIDLYISGHQHAYFPAQENGLRLLNTGCIGDGPRQIIGDTTAAKRAYTIINIPFKDYKKFSYQTFIPETNKEINLTELPDSVIGFNGISRRERN